MIFPPSARFALALFFALAASHCDPVEDVPPPATAENAVTTTPANSGAQSVPSPPEPSAPAPLIKTDADEGAAEMPPSESLQPGEYAVGADSDSYEDNDPSALTDFRPTLDPYGAWADDPTYGTVWVPSRTVVGADFRPYATSGHWVYDNDWVWASDYSWGWAPFHYGRWVVIEGRGWSWIPGHAYRGAWVDWSVDDGYGYLGWAPAPPLFVWFGGAPVGWRHGYVNPRWSYCARSEVFAPAVSAHILVGAPADALSGRMRMYATASARAGGPPPERLGYAAAQVPHPTGDAQTRLVRAQQFARPSTAQPLGGRPPSRAPLPGRPAAVGGFARPNYSPATRAAAPIPQQRSTNPVAPRPPTFAPRAPEPAHFHGGGGGGRHR